MIDRNHVREWLEEKERGRLASLPEWLKRHEPEIEQLERMERADLIALTRSKLVPADEGGEFGRFFRFALEAVVRHNKYSDLISLRMRTRGRIGDNHRATRDGLDRALTAAARFLETCMPLDDIASDPCRPHEAGSPLDEELARKIVAMRDYSRLLAQCLRGNEIPPSGESKGNGRWRRRKAFSRLDGKKDGL
jgi:hypothetical protein